jgi:hypothetical protein
MHWDRKLHQRIALKDGRTILTLTDARRVLLSLPRSDQITPHWRHTGYLLSRAASRDENVALDQVQAQLPRVLRFTGLI